MLTNMFLPKLQELAAQQSPALREIIQLKSDSDPEEDATDPQYLRSAFTILSCQYITAIDQGDINFANNSERMTFIWLLQLLVDYATAGKMEDLLAIPPAVKEKIDELSGNTKKQS